MTERQCPSCGSTSLEPGHVQSTGAIYFRPDNTRFLTLKTADVRLHANLCTECGVVTLVGNVEKARRLTEKTAAY